MEDNNDMPSASTLETQPIGGAGGAAAAAGTQVPDPMSRQALPPKV